MAIPLIFSGSASTKLAMDVAKHLGTRVGEVEFSNFTNDEIRVWVKEKRVNGHAIVIQSLPSPTERNLVEFCLLCDALARMGIADITAVAPWLGYSKQDKVFRPGEPLSIKVIAKMLQVVPIKRLYTFDLHNLAILGFFDVPVTNLSARDLFVEYFKKQITDKTVVVAPDAGAVKSSTSFAQDIGVNVVYMDKKRDLTTGNVSVVGMSRSVEGLDVVIVDDMIVTGGTLIETAKALKEAGAKKISVAATHHLYVTHAQEAIEKSGIDHIVVTDTVTPREKSSKLTVLSVASIIADCLRET